MNKPTIHNQLRQPLVSIEQAGETRFHSQLATAHESALDAAFSSPIRISYDKSDGLEMYVDKRYPKEHTPASKHAVAELYERSLSETFWHENAHLKPISFLLGPVGCGKSTFLRYFLYEYCPRYSGHAEEHKRKFIIDVNLRGISSASELEAELYQQMRDSIVKFARWRGFDLISADNYGMFDPIFNWNSALYADITLKEKEHLVKTKLSTMSDREFVHWSLAFISRQMTSRDMQNAVFPFTFLVLVIDNLDNSPYELVSKVIDILQRWIELKWHFWKIYIPLWPTTFYSLKEKYKPRLLESYGPPTHLGRVDENELFEKRNTKAMSLIRKSGKPVSVLDGNERITLSTNDVIDYFQSAREEARFKFRTLLKNLSGQSIAWELGLWENTLRSRNLELHYLRRKSYGARDSQGGGDESLFDHVTNYAWCDALFTGVSEQHNKASSPIPNLFYATGKCNSHYDALIGVHIITMIKCKNMRSCSSIVGELTSWGYTADDVMAGLEYLRGKHLFEWQENTRGTSVDLYPGTESAFWALLELPAYIDNVAMTTPVEMARLKDMSRTCSQKTDEFVARVRTTAQFLEQIRTDETRFSTFYAVSPHDNELFEHVAKRFLAAEFYNVTKIMCSAYRSRLVALREKGYFPALRHDWLNLLNMPVFRNLDGEPTFLQPKLFA